MRLQLPRRRNQPLIFNSYIPPELHSEVDCTRKHVKLLLACELHEVHSITADADGELRILLRMLHCVEQEVAIEHVHIDVLSTGRCEVAIEQVDGATANV